MQVQSEQKDNSQALVKPEFIQPQVTTLNNPFDFVNIQTTEPYFIVRTLSKNSSTEALGWKLYPGDLIKMGKIEFKVISIDGVSLEDKNSEYDRRAIEMTQIDEE